MSGGEMQTGPGFGPRIAQLFEERGASPFEADVRELISELEERVS